MTVRETEDLGSKDVLLAKGKMLFLLLDQTYPRTTSRFKFSSVSENVLIVAASCRCGTGKYQTICSKFIFPF